MNRFYCGAVLCKSLFLFGVLLSILLLLGFKNSIEQTAV